MRSPSSGSRRARIETLARDPADVGVIRVIARANESTDDAANKRAPVRDTPASNETIRMLTSCETSEPYRVRQPRCTRALPGFK